MPKTKSHKGLLKRIRITGTGKIKFRKAFTGHMRSHKSGQTLMKLRGKSIAKRADLNRLSKMLGNRRLRPADAKKTTEAAAE